MTDLIIKKLNSTFIRVECKEVHMEVELADRFKFKNKGVEFDPRVKRGHWDGYIRLYNRTHKRIYTGLLMEVIKFAKNFNYTYTIDPELLPTSSISLEDIKDVVENFIKPHDDGNPLTPYDYQYDAIHYALNMNRSIELAATSSGKSLIIYIMIRMYQMMDELEGKPIFIIVPNTMLVEQLYADFENYSNYEGTNWRPLTFCQKISGKYSKHINKPIVITTWQSVKNIAPGFIIDAGAIFVDEVHTVAGPVLAGILESAVNCDIRHGLTGTLQDMESSILSAEGLLGPSKVIVTAKENIDAGRATEVDITVVVLDYDVQTKIDYNNDQKNVSDASPTVKFQSEINFINLLESRKKFIQDLVMKCKGNTLVMFDRVDSYGIPLYEACKAVHENTFLITGDIDANERERIRLSLEGLTDAKVFATDKIVSTGVSIKNLHNGVLVSAGKAKIKLLQTLGRFMRLHKSKSKAYIYDLVDKIDYNGKPNYVLKHVEERIMYYKREGHKIKIISVNLDEHPGRITLL